MISTICLTLSLLAPFAPQEAADLRTAQSPVLALDDVTPAPGDVIEVHDIRDLTGQDRIDALERDIVSDTISVEARRVLLQRYRELLEKGEARSRAADFAATVKELCQPPLTGPGQSVESIGNASLVVVGSRDQQVWIRRFLTEARTFEGGIDIRSTILLLPRGKLAEVTGGRTGVVLTSDAADELIASLEGADVLTTPRVMTLPGQRANLSVLDQTAYIKDFELTLVPDRAEEIADPVIDVIESGLTMDLRATPIAAGLIALRTDLSLSDAPRPFPEKTLRLGARGVEVTIQLPEVHTVKVSGRFDIAPGSAVLIGGLDPHGASSGLLPGGARQGERDLLVVLRASRVEGAFEQDR